MKNSIICDIDGVVLQCPGWQDLDDFYANLDSCIPIDWAVYLIESLHRNGLQIIFLTARDVKCHCYTKHQLQQLFDFPILLYMRNHNDTRPDYVIKEEHIVELKQRYRILCCIDDNKDNCNMYRKHGLTALHVS